MFFKATTIFDPELQFDNKILWNLGEQYQDSFIKINKCNLFLLYHILDDILSVLVPNIKKNLLNYFWY